MRYLSIEDIVLQDSTRHMDKIQAHYNKEHTKEAVEAFLKLPKGVVFIYTGFYVSGFAETDGPIGAYFLAKALQKLGYKPTIITDLFCNDYFFDIPTIYIPISGLSDDECELLLSSYKPVCHFSIERCGANKDGLYLNARGVDISPFTAPLDTLFKEGGKSAPTFAIGDGGNEIGMGNFEEILSDTNYFKNYCVTKCDYPIIASVSNWGAYGFIAKLQKTLSIELMPSLMEIEKYLLFILTKGCVDGLKGESTMSVDGKPWDFEAKTIDELTQYIKG